MQFAGWAVAALFIPRLADIYGRKKMYFISMLCHGLIYFGIVMSRSLKLTTALMFFLGMAGAGRASVGYLYMLELTPLK